MSIIKTEAFVLKCFKYGETSKIVTLFTKDFGKMNAIVKGARNYKSKLCGTTESMNYINAVIYLKENRDLQLVSNAEYKKSFTNILTNFDKLESAYKIIEIMNKALIERYTNKLIFELLMKTFLKLDIAEKNYLNYVLYFQIRLTSILGLYSDFSQKDLNSETFFGLNQFYLNKSDLNNLQLIARSNLWNLESLELNRNTIERLIINYEKHISSQVSGSRFYKSARVFQELNN